MRDLGDANAHADSKHGEEDIINWLANMKWGRNSFVVCLAVKLLFSWARSTVKEEHGDDGNTKARNPSLSVDESLQTFNLEGGHHDDDCGQEHRQ